MRMQAAVAIPEPEKKRLDRQKRTGKGFFRSRIVSTPREIAKDIPVQLDKLIRNYQAHSKHVSLMSSKTAYNAGYFYPQEKQQTSLDESREYEFSYQLFSRMMKEKVIRATFQILKLRDNWDGENSKSYTLNTVKRATTFLQSALKEVWDDFGGIDHNEYNIFPSQDGSIDIHWKNDRFELLVNFPSDPDEPVTLYGEDYGNNEIDLSVDFNNLDQVIVPWLRLFRTE
ncbi:MAG: hypothetical protein ACFFD4_02195 [Candidatus Odinarchaeota archaeon]